MSRDPLLDRLRQHIAQMAPHQRNRESGWLMVEAEREIVRLREENLRMEVREAKAHEIAQAAMKSVDIAAGKT